MNRTQNPFSDPQGHVKYPHREMAWVHIPFCVHFRGTVSSPNLHTHSCQVKKTSLSSRKRKKDKTYTKEHQPKAEKAAAVMGQAIPEWPRDTKADFSLL